MKNNKGFSLVELIIVIAIMAILVGVMAPQLIKYIEKTNVSADVQLCDTIRQAIQTAYMDPSVLTQEDTVLPAEDTDLTVDAIDSKLKNFYEAVKDTLGAEPNTMENKIKSYAKKTKNNGTIMYRIDKESGAIAVWITKSDMSGKKSSFDSVKTTGDSAIWAGDYSAFGTKK